MILCSIFIKEQFLFLTPKEIFVCKKNKVHIVRNIRKQLYVKKGQLFEQISVKLKKCNRILNLFLPIPLTWLQKTRTNNLKNFCF